MTLEPKEKKDREGIFGEFLGIFQGIFRVFFPMPFPGMPIWTLLRHEVALPQKTYTKLALDRFAANILTQNFSFCPILE